MLSWPATRVLVMHRMDVARRADLVGMLDSGGLTGFGRSEVMLAAGSGYHQLSEVTGR